MAEQLRETKLSQLNKVKIDELAHGQSYQVPRVMIADETVVHPEPRTGGHEQYSYNYIIIERQEPAAAQSWS